MAEVRLPVVTGNDIELFSAGTADRLSSYITNGIVLKHLDGTAYITQRPGVQIVNDPDGESVTDNRGRGIEYWDDASALYIVNNQYIYRGTYATKCAPSTEYTITAGTAGASTELTIGSHALLVGDLFYTAGATFATTSLPAGEYEITAVAATTITVLYTTSGSYTGSSETVVGVHFKAGTSRIYIAELGDDLVFVDPSGNTSCYINDAADTTVVNMADNTTFAALPPNNSRTFAHGIAVLDQTMYVLATDGTVWGSALADAQDWSDALNFVSAEKEEDAGVWIGKHHDNIVVMGTRTIQFFYNADNPTGSPLSARDDISYNIGCIDGNSVWRNGDDIYFLGVESGGEIAAYVLSGFQIKKISDTTLTSLLSYSKSNDDVGTFGSGFSAGNITFYILTTHSTPSDIKPTISFVFNSSSGTWTLWDHADSPTTIEHFPVIGATTSAPAGQSRMQFVSGEVANVKDGYIPTDNLVANSYYVDGYISDGYFVQDDGNSWNIPMTVRINHWDGGTRNWKFMSQLRYVGDATYNSQTMTIKWADDNTKTFNTGRTIDISNSNNKLTALGRTKSRSFQCEYSGDEQIRFEALDLEVMQGTH